MTGEAVPPFLEPVVVRVSTALYTESAIFRACHRFTGHYYVRLNRDAADEVAVEFCARAGATAITDLAGEFANELIDQRVRADIDLETRRIREIIVGQAFAEASFREDRRDDKSPATPS